MSNVRVLTAQCPLCGATKPVREMNVIAEPVEYAGVQGYTAHYECKEDCEPQTAEDIATRECIILAEHRRRHGR